MAVDDTATDALRSQILEEFEKVLAKHFDLEEKFLVPPLRRAGRSGLVDRLLSDHAAIRTIIDREGKMTPADVRTLGNLLEEHIRFEEREFFEEAQRILNDNDLKALADAIALG